MKYLILGDIHGVEYWKNVIELENPNKVVFVGDYLDSFTIGVDKQAKNFENILEYKKSNSDKVILLTGNHDWHYSDLCSPFEQYSGYKHSLKTKVNKSLTKALRNKDIQAAYLIDNYLITHAGVSKTWLSYLTEKFGDYEKIDDFINEALLTSPYLFDFNGYNVYGDNKTQGPLWIRPNSLHNDMIEGYIQIVGHTKQSEITTIIGENGPELYLIDTFSERSGYDAYYITIENGEINKKSYKIS